MGASISLPASRCFFPPPRAGEGQGGGFNFPPRLGGGSGRGFEQDDANLFQDAFRLLKNFVVPETQDSEAPTSEPRRAPFISAEGRLVLAAVDLDNELSFYAEEIDDVRSHGNLATEVVAAHLVCAESEPKTNFSICHLFAQFSGSLRVGPRHAGHNDHQQRYAPTLPSPASGGGKQSTRSACPSPASGRGKSERKRWRRIEKQVG